MTVHRVLLPPGEHKLEGTIEDSRLDLVDEESGLARVVLTVNTPQMEATVGRRELLLGRRTPTNLAILMGRDATLKLMRDLASVARTMGWRPPPLGGGPH
jgi:hypothetical protein